MRVTWLDLYWKLLLIITLTKSSTFGVCPDPMCKGEQGLRGPKGDQGRDGFPGLKGRKGDQGLPGSDGLPGGPSGPKGDAGEKGGTGNPGLPGSDGLPGGSSGPKGDAGEKGGTGNPGLPGMPGLSAPIPSGCKCNGLTTITTENESVVLTKYDQSIVPIIIIGIILFVTDLVVIGLFIIVKKDAKSIQPASLEARYQSVQPRDQAETDERYRQLEHAAESQDPNHYMEVIDSNDVAH
ncbi:unnamed protein product [Mytilus edulis]|nr:unnamed protein product [Mytilus edulis]